MEENITLINKTYYHINPISLGSEAGYIFKSMLKASQMAPGRTEYICSKIWELFSAVMEKKEKRIDYIENALNIIHSEYMQDVTIQEIAERLNLDRTYFSHLFKKNVGVSPKKYLLSYRMNLAADLIANHGQSISTTAFSVGYNDIYIFSKMFKQFFGVAPSQYKREVP